MGTKEKGVVEIFYLYCLCTYPGHNLLPGNLPI